MELLSKSKSTGTETAKQKTRVKMPVKVQKKLQTSNKFCVDCGEEGTLVSCLSVLPSSPFTCSRYLPFLPHPHPHPRPHPPPRPCPLPPSPPFSLPLQNLIILIPVLVLVPSLLLPHLLTPAEPDWASINLGILFCRNCSGPHRAMGTSISKVRSISIDNWDIQSFKVP
jgi:hypothetical protein